MKSDRKEIRILAGMMIYAFLCSVAASETIYVNANRGSDLNDGTEQKPLKTIGRAAVIINNKEKGGPATIKVTPGIYNLDETIVFGNIRTYTEKSRLTIEAAVSPEDPNWQPALMPIILSTEDPRKPDKPKEHTETYSFKIKTSHVTIRGLKFLGNPLTNNWHCCVERVGEKLDDLFVTQCMFVGDGDGLDIYCPVIGNGDRIVVEHTIFHNCNASAVFWDGPEGIGGRDCAMRYCIVDGGYISGVWTCHTGEDFDFQNNIIAGCEYFWIRRKGDEQKYKIKNCIITDNRFYSGYGVESGATGQTGSEVIFDEENVIKEGRVILEKNKKARNYLHIVEGSFGYKLGAGLFKR